MKIELYEMNYSVSPGGIDCWEMDVRVGLGRSSNYSDFKSAGDAINFILDKYPGVPLELNITSLQAYEREKNG